MLETRLRDVGVSVIMKGYKIGEASDFWNLYADDIKRAADLGKVA